MGSGFKDLIVYKKAFTIAMEIFNTTKKFPKEVGRLLNHMIEHPKKYQRADQRER